MRDVRVSRLALLLTVCRLGSRCREGNTACSGRACASSSWACDCDSSWSRLVRATIRLACCSINCSRCPHWSIRRSYAHQLAPMRSGTGRLTFRRVNLYKLSVLLATARNSSCLRPISQSICLNAIGEGTFLLARITAGRRFVERLG